MNYSVKLFIVLTFLFTTPIYAYTDPISLVTTKFHALHTNPDVIILDARTKQEFENSHIPNAHWIDITDIQLDLHLKKLDKKKTYIIYGGKDKRAILLLNRMQERGFSHLYHAIEGIDGWKRKAFPLTKGG